MTWISPILDLTVVSKWLTVLAAPLQNMEVADNIIHLFTCFRLMEKVIGAAEKNDAVTKLAE